MMTKQQKTSSQEPATASVNLMHWQFKNRSQNYQHK